MPLDSEAQNRLEGPPPAPGGVTASATVPPAFNTFVVANATVLRALDRAGKKLLDRNSRAQWPGVPGHELHTRIRVGDRDRASKLLDGAWDHLPHLAASLDDTMDTGALQGALHEYCVKLLVAEQSHDVQLLGQYLRQQGFLDGAP